MTQRAVRESLAWLERKGSARTRAQMETQFGIRTAKAFGVPVGAIDTLARKLGRDHTLAAALWETGWYEARLLATMVDDPLLVTSAQMDRWARDFDNWGICDTACFKLFDRTPHAWRKIEIWSGRRAEFVKRGAFALLASVALHDRGTADAPFLRSLALIEGAAGDDRNFVWKGVSWALRSVGRRNRALNTASVALARRLTAAPEPSARRIGKEAMRDLSGPVVRKRLSRLGPSAD